MSRVCQVTGKRPMSGHNVSHANNKTKRRFDINIKTKRFYVESEDKFVKLRVSADGIRTINKLGIEIIGNKSDLAEKRVINYGFKSTRKNQISFDRWYRLLLYNYKKQTHRH